MNERLARHQLVNDIDEQIHLAREGKFQANKNLNPFILKIGPVPTVASARSGFDRTADPDYSRPSQPYQQRFSTYSPREISSTPYPTSQTHQAIVRAPQSISMSYDPNASRAYADRPGPDDLRASGHRPGPQRTRRGHYLASEEAYRRTFREESRNHRSTPYVIPRPRTPRRTNFFDEVDINGVPIDETTERGPTPATRAHLPARTTNGTMEAERFLRQSDLIYSSSGPGRRFVSVVPAYGRQAATSIFSTPSRPSSSSAGNRPLQQQQQQQAGFSRQTDLNHSSTREQLHNGTTPRSSRPTSTAFRSRSSSQQQQQPPILHQAAPRQSSSFNTMITRMVSMLAAEGIRATFAQVEEMVLRLQQPRPSLASVTIDEDEDTASRFEDMRAARRFR